MNSKKMPHEALYIHYYSRLDSDWNHAAIEKLSAAIPRTQM